MQYPDEQLPTAVYSLQEFNQIAQELYSANELDRLDFVNFVLGGRRKTENRVERVHIDVFQNHISLAGRDDITITRDYDSLIGITSNLPFCLPIAIYPAANFRDSLKTSNHIKKSIQLPVSRFVQIRIILKPR